VLVGWGGMEFPGWDMDMDMDSCVGGIVVVLVG